MKNRFDNITKDFLVHVFKDSDTNELSQNLGYQFNICERWLSGQKKFSWQNFMSLAFHKKWDVNFAVRDSFKVCVDDLNHDHIVLSALISTVGEKELAYEFMSKQKIYRVLSGKRKLQFSEFALLADRLTGYLLSFLSHFLDQKSRDEMKKIYTPTDCESLDINLIAILESFSLYAYKKTSRHCDESLARLLGIDSSQLKKDIKRLNDLGLIKKNKDDHYQSVEDRLPKFLSTDNSRLIHNQWRNKIHEKIFSKNQVVRGAHLTYCSSEQLDKKIVEIHNRFFNELNLIIREYDKKGHSSNKVVTLSTSFLDY